MVVPVVKLYVPPTVKIAVPVACAKVTQRPEIELPPPFELFEVLQFRTPVPKYVLLT